MPWTISNPPPPAKNWPEEAKRKCVAAGNAALRAGKSDREAVFACIAAAGMSKKQQDEYEEAIDKDSKVFQQLVAAYLAGRLLRDEFERRFRQAIEAHHMRLMLLHVTSETISIEQRTLLQRFITRDMQYFDGFLNDLDGMTESRALWRASLYGYSRSTYIAFSIPLDVALVMPFLPGEDCLGGDLCGCHLEVEYHENEVWVHWIVDPAKESCEVCLQHMDDSPFIFEVTNASTG